MEKFKVENNKYGFEEGSLNKIDSIQPEKNSNLKSLSTKTQLKIPKSQKNTLIFTPQSKHPWSERDPKEIVREMHLKVTDQRLSIIQAIIQKDNHFTVQEIFELVHAIDSSVGFTTVYRFLRSLTEHKLASEIRMGGLPARYEIATKNHHDHLSCSSCGKIIEFENFEIEKLQEQVAEKFGFKLTGHVLELYGVCPQCQKNHGLG